MILPWSDILNYHEQSSIFHDYLYSLIISSRGPSECQDCTADWYPLFYVQLLPNFIPPLLAMSTLPLSRKVGSFTVGYSVLKNFRSFFHIFLSYIYLDWNCILRYRTLSWFCHIWTNGSYHFSIYGAINLLKFRL